MESGQYKKMKVMVVDDQPQNLQLAGSILNPFCQLTLVNRGDKAIRLAHEKKPDLILLDIMMPEMNGLETCTQLKSSPDTKDIPVIFLTAKIQEEDIISAYEAGAVDYITKPFRSKELVARIKAHLTLKHQKDRILQLNAELHAHNLNKDKLFSIISHDLRGSAYRIDSLVDMMMREHQTTGLSNHFGEYLLMLKKSASSSRELLEELLIWSRNQFDLVSYNPVEFNIQSLIEKVVQHIEPQSQSKQIPIRFDVDPSCLTYGDPDMVNTILRNLISNAIKFSNPGKEVSIKAEQKGEGTLITVRDQGVGIDIRDQKKLFDPVQGFTSYGTSGEKGSGIGLGLCKDFVEKHGGKLWVESEIDKGSTFYFTLPHKG